MSSLGYGAEENGFEFQQAKPTTRGRLAYKGEFFCFFFLGGGMGVGRVLGMYSSTKANSAAFHFGLSRSLSAIGI